MALSVRVESKNLCILQRKRGGNGVNRTLIEPVR